MFEFSDFCTFHIPYEILICHLNAKICRPKLWKTWYLWLILPTVPNWEKWLKKIFENMRFLNNKIWIRDFLDSSHQSQLTNFYRLFAPKKLESESPKSVTCKKSHWSQWLSYLIAKSAALLIVRYETAVPANRETRLLSLAMERVGTLGLAKQFAF